MQRIDSIDLESSLRMARAGNRDSLQSLLVQCRPLLKLVARRHIRQRFRTRFDESDVVQLALVAATDGFRAFQGKSDREFIAWLQTILRRTLSQLHEHHSLQLRDVGREVGELVSSEDDDIADFSVVWNHLRSGQAGPRTEVIEGERAIIIAAALQQLPDDYRRVIELRYLDGKKIREIAESMDASLGRIAGLLRRALDDLYTVLPEELRAEFEDPAP